MTQAAGHPTVSFGDAILAGFRQYAEFGGRAGVAEFWWFVLFVTLVTSGLGALNVATPNGVIGLIVMAIRMSEPSKP